MFAKKRKSSDDCRRVGRSAGWTDDGEKKLQVFILAMESCCKKIPRGEGSFSFESEKRYGRQDGVFSGLSKRPTGAR